MGNRHRWFLHLTQKASVPAHRQRRGRLKPSYLVISLVSSSPIATIPWFFRESERAALCCARDPPFRTQPPPCPQREGRTEPIDTTGSNEVTIRLTKSCKLTPLLLSCYACEIVPLTWQSIYYFRHGGIHLGARSPSGHLHPLCSSSERVLPAAPRPGARQGQDPQHQEHL